MFLMKNKITLFLSACLTLLLSSCLGGDDTYDYEAIKDPQVYRFHLKSDSVPALDSVKFTIDQWTGQIYNIDSMKYGTSLKDKVFCIFNTRSVYKIQVIQEALRNEQDPSKDTLDWNGIDSLNFSKPVIFITHAMDGKTKKRYEARVNIHQVNPDSMYWSVYKNNMIPQSFTDQTVLPNADTTQYTMYTKESTGYAVYTASAEEPAVWTPASLRGFPSAPLLQQMVRFDGDVFVVPTADGKIYKSENSTDWEVVPVAGDPNIAALLGVVPQSEGDILSVLVLNGSEYRYMTTSDLISWKESEGKASGDFPLSGFGRCTYTNYFSNGLMLVAGASVGGAKVSSSAWSTEDGLSWLKMTNETSYFRPRSGAMLTPYDNRFYLIGGMDTYGNAMKDIYTSCDYGITWARIDSMKIMPSTYNARAYASVQVNKDRTLFLFGGKTENDGTCLNQIWSGSIPRFVVAGRKE